MFFDSERNPTARFSCAALIRSLYVIFLFPWRWREILLRRSPYRRTRNDNSTLRLLAERRRTIRRLKRRDKAGKRPKQVPTQSLDAARPAIQFATCQRGQSSPLCRLHQQRFCLSRLRDLARHVHTRESAIEGMRLRNATSMFRSNRFETVRRAVLRVSSGHVFPARLSLRTLTILGRTASCSSKWNQAARRPLPFPLGNRSRTRPQCATPKNEAASRNRQCITSVGKLKPSSNQLLNRSQGITGHRTDRSSRKRLLLQAYAELSGRGAVQNPESRQRTGKMIEKQSLRVDLARKDFIPTSTCSTCGKRTDPPSSGGTTC